MNDTLSETNLNAWLDVLAQCVGDKLNADPWFADVPVIVDIKGSITTTVDLALAGTTQKANKAGVAVVVHPPQLVKNISEAPSGHFSVAVNLECLENYLVNHSEIGTGKSRSALAVNVLRVLHLFDIPAAGVQLMAADDPANFGRDDQTGDVIYVVKLTASRGLTSIATVATPSASLTTIAGGVRITATCATSGAAIWMHHATTGVLSRYPNPATVGGVGVLMTGGTYDLTGESVAVGDWLTFAAHKDGMQSSNQLLTRISAVGEIEAPAVTGLAKADASGGILVMSWNVVTGADSLELEVKPIGDAFDGTGLFTFDGSLTEGNADGLSDNTSYKARIRSVLGELRSEWSATASPLMTPPSADLQWTLTVPGFGIVAIQLDSEVTGPLPVEIDVYRNGVLDTPNATFPWQHSGLEGQQDLYLLIRNEQEETATNGQGTNF